jgi:muramidase (phage lysozyme)
MFKNIQLNTDEFTNTEESILTQVSLVSSGQPVLSSGKLFSAMESRSYSCTVTSLGNMSIQPLSYFYLKNVPLFYGTYWITNVSHKISPNNITTTFKGTRQPIARKPTANLSIITAILKIAKDNLALTAGTDRSKFIPTATSGIVYGDKTSNVSPYGVLYQEADNFKGQYVSYKAIDVIGAYMSKLCRYAFGGYNKILAKTLIAYLYNNASVLVGDSEPTKAGLYMADIVVDDIYNKFGDTTISLSQFLTAEFGTDEGPTDQNEYIALLNEFIGKPIAEILPFLNVENESDIKIYQTFISDEKGNAVKNDALKSKATFGDEIIFKEAKKTKYAPALAFSSYWIANNDIFKYKNNDLQTPGITTNYLTNVIYNTNKKGTTNTKIKIKISDNRKLLNPYNAYLELYSADYGNRPLLETIPLREWLEKNGNKDDLDAFNTLVLKDIFINFDYTAFTTQIKDKNYFFKIRYGNNSYDSVTYDQTNKPIVLKELAENYYSFKSVGKNPPNLNVQALGITTGTTFDYKNSDGNKFHVPDFPNDNDKIYNTSYNGALGLDKNKIAFLRLSLNSEITKYTDDVTTRAYIYSKHLNIDPNVSKDIAWSILEATTDVTNNLYITPRSTIKGGSRPINKEKLASFGKVSTSVPVEGRAVLDMLAYTEGTAGAGPSKNGYDILVGFNAIDGWTDNTAQGHPNVLVKVSSSIDSTAAGRYQFLYKTWVGSNNNVNKPFTKQNQDNAGWSLIINSVNGGQTTVKAAYTAAINGIKDVNQNPSFLQMLGKKVAKGQSGYGKGLSYVWASVPDQNSDYIYGGQGGAYTTQSLYEIYLKAVNPNSNTATATTAAASSTTAVVNTITIGDSISVGVDSVYKNINGISTPVLLNKVGWTASNLLNEIKKVKTPYKDVKNLVLSIGSNDAWALPSGLNNGTEQLLVDNIKRVFPNAKLYILNGSYGWLGLSVTTTNTAAIWENKITNYIKWYTDKGFTAVGTLNTVKAHPAAGDALFNSFKPILSKL